MLLKEYKKMLEDISNFKITNTSLAKALNTSSQNISKRIKNGSILTTLELTKLENYYKTNQTVDLKTPKSIQKVVADNDCIKITVRGEIKRGYGVTFYDEAQTATYSISSKLAKDLGVDVKNSGIIFGAGNAMEPTIKGGDALLVDLTRKEINDGKIYCIMHNGQLKPKRLQQISDTKIKIISDNKEYEPVLIDIEKDLSVNFEVIGEIRWCGRIFL